LLRPERTGVKCVLEYGDEILLVRLAYAHKKWTVPGGAPEKGETLEETARREIKEEVGIKDIRSIRSLGSYFRDVEHKQDTLHCFLVAVGTKDFSVDGLEVAEAGWFKKDTLPEDLGSQVKVVLQKYFDHKEN
tara:strand:- start:32967 stop:33365 length:399 start_codon:yes stop_codon:yes gene_type:complete